MRFIGYQTITLPQAGLHRTRCAVFRFQPAPVHAAVLQKAYASTRVTFLTLRETSGSWVTLADPGFYIYDNPAGEKCRVALVPMVNVATTWRFDIHETTALELNIPWFKRIFFDTSTTVWTSGDMRPPI